MERFVTGKTYECRSICDYDCVWSYEVVKRTESTVTIKDTHSGEVSTKRVLKCSEHFGVEMLEPLGHYSMCPTLSADKAVEAPEVLEEQQTVDVLPSAMNPEKFDVERFENYLTSAKNELKSWKLFYQVSTKCAEVAKEFEIQIKMLDEVEKVFNACKQK